VGYSGGTSDQPTYRRIGDHSETIQIDFDPRRISYRQLVKIFWQDHDPTQPLWSRQYMSAAFYHDADQKRIVEETRAEEAARRNKAIATEVRPAGEFYRAEDYHQKYYLRRQRRLADEYQSIYPDPRQ
jgi:peptide-methionine (S)-S-oxide reductase